MLCMYVVSTTSTGMISGVFKEWTSFIFCYAAVRKIEIVIISSWLSMKSKYTNHHIYENELVRLQLAVLLVTFIDYIFFQVWSVFTHVDFFGQPTCR